MWVYLRVDEPIPHLCFTANTAGSTIKLSKTWSPTAVTLETSTDWDNWSTYTIWDTITLSNIWDKVYWRNASETTTWFSIASASYYRFLMTGSVATSWDVTSLINKNLSTQLISAHNFDKLFYQCTSLTTTPKIPATTLTDYCYSMMFDWCTNLVTACELPATTLTQYCYYAMFLWCSSLTQLSKLSATTILNYSYNSMFGNCPKIKLSTTQTWEYQTPYRIPTTWTGSSYSNALNDMFYGTWWTWTWTPSINTTYYTSNTVV